jgi:cytochrome c2
MYPRSYISIGLALLFTLVFAFPAFAGGWAVITLDELPSNVLAGEPLTIGFTVLQHGRTPMSGLDPTVTAKLTSTEEMVVHAEPKGEPGHYEATLTFPKEGNWEWSIQAFTMDQPMPTLNVAAPNVVAANEPVTKTESKPASITPLLLVRVLVFGLAIVGLILAFQRKSDLAGTFAGLCLLVGVGTFMTGTITSKAEAQTQGEASSEVSTEFSAAQVEMGRQLFIAKGCITCHYNSRVVERSGHWTIEIGAPDLSNYSSAPEILFIRLKDPAAARSDTKMPNLGLKEAEIEALIAFINSK